MCFRCTIWWRQIQRNHIASVQKWCFRTVASAVNSTTPSVHFLTCQYSVLLLKQYSFIYFTHLALWMIKCTSECLFPVICVCVLHETYCLTLKTTATNMMCICMYWFRFTSTQEGKPIDTANCLSPRSYKKVRGGRAAFLARRWSCLPCCALKLVTTWPSSNMAAQTLPGSSSTAWLTVTVSVMAFDVLFVMTSNGSLNEVVICEICGNAVFAKEFHSEGIEHYGTWEQGDSLITTQTSLHWRLNVQIKVRVIHFYMTSEFLIMQGISISFLF